MIRVLRLTVVLFIVALSVAAAQAQYFAPQKDLPFGQVAAGSGYETMINVTNRGPATYNGTIFFWRNQGAAWNPIVNSVAVTGGQLPVVILPGHTNTYRVTASQLEAGFAYFYADSIALNSFIEGNLSYYVKSGSTVVDSIGVAPSLEFYLTSIPFDDFNTIALALANPDTEITANIIIKLFDSNGILKKSALNLTLAPNQHYPHFLSEIFPNTTLGQGKVEISSDNPIIGAALTLVGNQLSSLPMLSSPVGYTFQTQSGSNIAKGIVWIWTSGGPFVQGYMYVNELNSQAVSETYPIHGRLYNGYLRISFYGNEATFYNTEVVTYVYIPNFSFATTSASTSFVGFFLDDYSHYTGTIYLTRITN